MTKAHGLRGDVIVRLTTDRTEERTAPGAVFFVDGRTLEVAAAKPYQKNWLVTFVGVDSREAADSLRGAVLQADEIVGTDLVFAHQLIGKRIVDQHGGTIAVDDNHPKGACLVVTLPRGTEAIEQPSTGDVERLPAATTRTSARQEISPGARRSR